MKFRSLKDGQPRQTNRKSGCDLRQSSPAQIASHQAAHQNRRALGQHRKQPQPGQRKPEDSQCNSFQERRHRGVGYKSPIQVTRIAQELQLVAMKTITAVGGYVGRDKHKRNADEYRAVRGDGLFRLSRKSFVNSHLCVPVSREYTPPVAQMFLDVLWAGRCKHPISTGMLFHNAAVFSDVSLYLNIRDNGIQPRSTRDSWQN